MSNSTLVSYTRYASHHYGKRTQAIDRITPHHAAGVRATAEAIGTVFADPDNWASSNYGVGYDGKIALYVDEDNAAMTSSSRDNDQRAVTIEIANSDGWPDWPVSDASWDAAVALCADICRRNGRTKLLWLGDKETALAYAPGPGEMVLTVHRWFAATSCPGNYLYGRMGDLAAEVTARLTPETAETEREELEMKRYNRIDEMPLWAQDTAAKLCDRGITRGAGAEVDGNGRPADLDLSEDMLRLLVWNDRAGLYDGEGDTDE